MNWRVSGIECQTRPLHASQGRFYIKAIKVRRIHRNSVRHSAPISRSSHSPKKPLRNAMRVCLNAARNNWLRQPPSSHTFLRSCCAFVEQIFYLIASGAGERLKGRILGVCGRQMIRHDSVGKYFHFTRRPICWLIELKLQFYVDFFCGATANACNLLSGFLCGIFMVEMENERVKIRPDVPFMGN